MILMKLFAGQQWRQWRRKWQPTPALLPGEPHGQRSLVGCSLWGHKNLDMAKPLTHTMETEMYRTDLWTLERGGRRG